MSRLSLRPALRMAARGGARRDTTPALTLTATTTGAAQTVTIHRMTPAAGKSLVISWGDGNSTTVAAGDTANKSNTYASAGSYSIRVTNALDIVQIDLHDTKLSGFNSAQLARSALTYFLCYSLGSAVASVVNSADMTSWACTSWRVYSLVGGTYAIDSSHLVGWPLTDWRLYNMAAGTYAIDTADFTGPSLVSWYLDTMPAGTYTFAAANMATWTKVTSVIMSGLALSQAIVDAVLWGLYQAALSRTATGGTISLGGTNAAPSGTYQAAAACPVSAATPGKEIAHELQNDGCNAIAAGETWTTVTITA